MPNTNITISRFEPVISKMAFRILLAILLFNGSLLAQITYRQLHEFPGYKLLNSDSVVFNSLSVVKPQKPTVIIYFSPTCHHCQSQATDITSNMNVFKDVQFLFVTSYPAADTKSFLSEYAIEKFKNITFGYDPQFAMGRFFELKSLPGVFIYDKNKQFKKAFETNVKPEKLYAAIFDEEN
jgi:thiol-disulfide isomerase/thioredoxin